MVYVAWTFKSEQFVVAEFSFLDKSDKVQDL